MSTDPRNKTRNINRHLTAYLLTFSTQTSFTSIISDVANIVIFSKQRVNVRAAENGYVLLRLNENPLNYMKFNKFY